MLKKINYNKIFLSVVLSLIIILAFALLKVQAAPAPNFQLEIINLCGNAVVDSGEECDGADLDGQTCSSKGFSGGGTLSCNVNCSFNTSACSSGGGGGGYIPLCTGYTYSPWSACIDSLQTRTVVTTIPSPCSGGLVPADTQTCTVATTTATSTVATTTATTTVATTTATSTIATTTATSTPATTTPITISIHPASSTIFTGGTIQLIATVTGTTSQLVAWTILPIETIINNFYGTISDTGFYTAPAHAVDITIQVRSLADITKLAYADVSVRLQPVATTTATTTVPEATSTPPEATTTVTQGTSTGPGEETPPLIVGGEGGVTGGGGTTSEQTETVTDIISNLNISNLITDNISTFGTTTVAIVTGAQEIVESPVGSAVTKTLSTAGVVGGGVAVTATLAFNGATIADLVSLVFRLWGLLVSTLGLKKRNRPWGTVYDSITKQPLDPAYVTLTRLDQKEENTSITDLDGRYGFLVSPGKYTLSANKTNYIFPSKKLLGQTEDILYTDLYFGEELDIQTAGTLISKNIPLDPLKFDWNEFVKGEKKLMRFYSRREKIVRMITDWVFRLGFVVSVVSLFLVASPYNFIIFGLYMVLTVFRRYGTQQKTLGSLMEKNGDPLSFAIIRVFDADLNVEITNKVADKIGRYHCLVPVGKYYVKVEKKNDDESYTVVYTSPVINANNGIIHNDFII